jgi:hypothetical protein
MQFGSTTFRRLVPSEDEEVTAGTSIMRSLKLLRVCQTKDNEKGGRCSTDGRDGKCIKSGSRNTGNKGALGRSRYRWVNNFKSDFKEV